MNYYTDVNVKAEQRHDALREAETSRLLRQAGIGRPGWLRVQVNKVECRVGGVLVDLGGRLMCRESGSQTAFSGYTS
jgi:hypothetical protein